MLWIYNVYIYWIKSLAILILDKYILRLEISFPTSISHMNFKSCNLNNFKEQIK